MGLLAMLRERLLLRLLRLLTGKLEQIPSNQEYNHPMVRSCALMGRSLIGRELQLSNEYFEIAIDYDNNMPSPCSPAVGGLGGRRCFRFHRDERPAVISPHFASTAVVFCLCRLRWFFFSDMFCHILRTRILRSI